VRHDFSTCDVFTDTRFGGNQLAVFPNAEGISAGQMQQIAREFNLAETAFVLPPAAGGTRTLRIFTPTCEVPFAGHPIIGTAATLAAHGTFGDGWAQHDVIFETAAGAVPVTLTRTSSGRFHGELQAPQPLTIGAVVAPALVAAAASLDASDIVTTTHQPHGASVGLSFLLAEVRDRATLARATPNVSGLDRLAGAEAGQPYLHLYVRSADDVADDVDLRARQFAASDPLLEDPATGSANAALAAVLAHYDRSAASAFRWRIAQGVEMGRPSLLTARALKQTDGVVHAWIGGDTVGVTTGTLEL
jgi:trans-2,3-dihydro-3-hydroxyanthranilate isomerase